MASTADVTVLDAPGDIDKKRVRDDFLVKIIEDVEALQQGAGFNFAALDALELDEGDYLFLRKAAEATSYKSTITSFATKVGATIPGFTTADQALLAGDGTTDDAPALQRAIDAAALVGGGTFVLKSKTNSSFRLNGKVRLLSNVSLIFLSGVLAGKKGGVTIAGQRASISGLQPFRLLSDATAGATTIVVDTAPNGGGVLSTYFAVDDYVEIIGALDSAGSVLESDFLRITAINDGTSTLTLAAAITSSYLVTQPTGAYDRGWGFRTIVRKIVVGLSTGDITAGSTLIQMSAPHAALFSVGNMVFVEDNKTAANVAGSDTTRIHVEQALVIPSYAGDPAGSIRIDRRLGHTFEIARQARVVKIEPAARASVQGLTLAFAETPDITPAAAVNPIEIIYALDSAIIDPAILNNDLFGTRGPVTRFDRSYRCKVINPTGRNSKYTGSNEGNGVVFNVSTACAAEGGEMSGMMHSVVFGGSTLCLARGLQTLAPREAPYSFRGAEELYCGIEDCHAESGSRYIFGEGKAPRLVRFGSATILAGAQKCFVRGGRAVGFKSDTASFEPLIEIFPPSKGCFVENLVCEGIDMLVRAVDTPSFSTLVSENCRIGPLSVDGCTDFLVDIDGSRNGSLNQTVKNFQIKGLVARNIGKMISAVQADEIEIVDCDLDEITPDAAFSYWATINNVTLLRIQGNKVTGSSRGVRVQSCPEARIVGNDHVNLSNTTVLLDAGGNTGLVWLNNRSLGFTPTASRTSTSVIAEHPGLAGSHTLADDAAFKFKPLFEFGFGTLQTNGAGYMTFRYKAGSSPVFTKVNGSTTPVTTGTTGALAGTTGTDTHLTISSHTDGYIYVENRTGASIEFILSWASI